MNYKSIANTNSIKDNKNLSYDDFCKNNILKQSKEGYSQFFGELFLNNIISSNVIIENINNMFNILTIILDSDQTDVFIEDLIICINKLILTIFNNIDKNYIKQILENIKKIDSNEKIIKRLKFKLMDLKDTLELKIKNE